MNAITTVNEASAALVEKVIIEGDLSKLTPSERINYYNAVCNSVGLNPLTKPFSYLTLNNKMVLYALKACTDQLRYIHKVSVEGMTNTTLNGVYIVTAKVKNADGRTDVDDGAVNIEGLKGEHLANAVMKASTKAKRRATLSICGLGMLDETEVDSIPGAVKGEPSDAPMQTVTTLSPPSPPKSDPPAPPSAPKKTPSEWIKDRIDDVTAITSLDAMTDFEERHGKHISAARAKEPEMGQILIDAIQAKQVELF